jgi:hypothetical protein
VAVEAAGHFAQPGSVGQAGGQPDPNPGTFDAGNWYKDGTLRVTYSATFSTYLEVHPYYTAQEIDSAHAYYMTATNRVDAGFEVLTRFRVPQGNPDDVEVFQVYDWSCTVDEQPPFDDDGEAPFLPGTADYPCDNGYPETPGTDAFVRTWRLPEQPCWYKMLEDNTGHYVNYLYYRNSSWILEPRDPPADPPLWRNAVSVWNFCTGQYDGAYSHDYAFNQTDCSLSDDGNPDTDEGCAGWAGVAERWYGSKPASILKQGFHHQNLEYDGQSTPLWPADTAFIDPSSGGFPWQVYYLSPNHTWEAGTYQDDDGDDIANDVDPDVDGDGAPNGIEAPCGATVPPHTPPMQPEWHPYRQPERIDGAYSGVDEDGDTVADDLLAPGSETIDCDGDAFKGSVEQYVFSRASTVDDQAACAETPTPNDETDDRWPADFNDSKSVNITDVLVLKPVFGGSSAPPRYDIVPSDNINVTDVLALKPVFGTSCSTPQGG